MIFFLLKLNGFVIVNIPSLVGAILYVPVIYVILNVNVSLLNLHLLFLVF